MGASSAPDSVPSGYEHVEHVLVFTESREWLTSLGLTSVAGAFSCEAQRRGPEKALARLPAPDGSTVFVKRYDFNRPSLFVRGMLKLNFPVYSGPRELDNLLAMRAAGLPVPTPLSAGTHDVGPRRQSFVALAELPGRPLHEVPAPAAPADRRARVLAVADLVQRLHSAGFWHKDLYACNLFWDPDKGLGLLDCERVERRAGGPPMRWRVKDLAALHYSSPWPTRTERLRFLLAYLGIKRPEASTRRLAHAIARKAARIARQGAKR
jgi:hypothetical protein